MDKLVEVLVQLTGTGTVGKHVKVLVQYTGTGTVGKLIEVIVQSYLGKLTGLAFK